MDMSALKGEATGGGRKAIRPPKAHKAGEHRHVFTGSVGHAIARIEESIPAG